MSSSIFMAKRSPHRNTYVPRPVYAHVCRLVVVAIYNYCTNLYMASSYGLLSHL